MASFPFHVFFPLSAVLGAALLLSVTTTTSYAKLPENHVALFIFGDSLYDAGNNVYEPSNGHINFYPYGITYFKTPTGRVSDGRIIPDFIAEHGNLPLIKPYLQPGFTDYTNGVNFASSGASVLPESRPFATYLQKQVNNFEAAAKKLKQQLGNAEANTLLSNAVYLFSIGGNDYADLGTTTADLKKQLIVRVLGNFSTAVKRVYDMGGRKFGFQNNGPSGCMPLTKASAKSNGECVHDSSVIAKMHNLALSNMLKKIQSSLPGFKYALYDYYTTLAERTRYSTKYGFKVGDTACCGSGPFNGYFTCGGKNGTVKYNLCSNASEYVWFDSAHPTESAYKQLAELFWSGQSTITGPYNLKALFSS